MVDISKTTFSNWFFYDNEFILIQISRKYVRKDAIYNKQALVRMKMIFL